MNLFLCECDLCLITVELFELVFQIIVSVEVCRAFPQTQAPYGEELDL